jgi:hypothetical protein
MLLAIYPCDYRNSGHFNSLLLKDVGKVTSNHMVPLRPDRLLEIATREVDRRL